MTQFVLTDVRVFTGTGLTAPQDVVVDGTTITEVRAHRAASAAIGDVVDGQGRTLLPGFIDTHIHLAGRDELEAAVHSGVTTMIDLGTHPASLVASLRQQEVLTDIRSAGIAPRPPRAVCRARSWASRRRAW